MTTALVCGGRDLNWPKPIIWRALDEAWRLHEQFDKMIAGGARGADTDARVWAQYRKIPCSVVPAKWDVYGKTAGAIRNQEMLDMKPDIVFAFPGGKGTADMVSRAKSAGVKVVELKREAVS